MKAIRFFTVLAALSGIFCSCSEKTSSSLADLKDRKLDLSIIDTLSYIFIPLETTAESLLANIRHIMIDGDYIFIVNRVEPEDYSVLIFDRTGKFLRKIHSIGRGPGEYYSHIEIDLDRESSLLLVYNMGNKEILRFNYDGSLHSVMKLPDYMGSNFRFLDNNRYAFHSGLRSKSGYQIVVLDSLGQTVEEHNPVDPLYSEMIQAISHTFFSKHSDGSTYYIPIWSDKIYRLSKEGVTIVVDFGLAGKMVRTDEEKRLRVTGSANKYDYFYRNLVNEEEQYISNISYNTSVYTIYGNIRNGKIEAGKMSISDNATFMAYGAAVIEPIVGHYQDYFITSLPDFAFNSLAPPELADRPVTDNPILVFFKIKI